MSCRVQRLHFVVACIALLELAECLESLVDQLEETLRLAPVAMILGQDERLNRWL
jgi:hypothetical protein